MDDNFDELVIDLRANTDRFNADIEGLRSTLDHSLIDGFDRAGSVLERGLLSAVRRGSLGFDDLQKVAFRSLDAIAARAISTGIGSLFGGSGSGGLGGTLTQTFGSLLGLPGRATGGPVSPGRGYVVGENGPELFVPTSSGSIAANRGAELPSRDVRVAIQLAPPRGTAAPTAMQRSSRQVASAVRRALSAQ
ncbi:tail tape measure protein [Qipengyuania sp. S6317L1]|uniref:tail tape measure protein n=1 Tax=Qipengyuania sp. S6317L1 TaxID=2926410 RepID=UPI001FF4D8A0|nr:tail tape measure protein [Qipengyuania sp. S6317L1]MCK0098887.1 tail tape measure protein [Qipengyuania sp. S6317L1]